MDKLKKEWKAPQLLDFGKVTDLTKLGDDKNVQDPGDGHTFNCIKIGPSGCSHC